MQATPSPGHRFTTPVLERTPPPYPGLPPESWRVGHRLDAATLGRLGVVAGVVAVLLQSLRVLFPVAYSYRERAGLAPTVLLLLVVFAAPMLAPVLTRVLRAPAALLVMVVAAGGLRLIVQFSDHVPVWLAAAAVAAGLVALAVALLALAGTGSDVALAAVAGLALDTALRGVWSTWDFAWRGDTAAAVVAVVLVGALLVATALVVRRGATVPTAGVARAGLVVGPYLLLQVLFLQSPAFVASSGDVALATAIAAVLAGDALALAGVWAVTARRVGAWTAVLAAAVVAVIGWELTSATGAGVVGLVLCAQLLATGLLALALQPLGDPGRFRGVRDAAGLAAGSLILGTLVLLYQSHYENPLPVSNRWLPVAAGALLGVSAIGAHVRAPNAALMARVAWRTAAGVAVVAVGLFAGLASTQPGVRGANTRPRELRVVTYNPHSTVTRHGQLDPEAMARTVEQLRPDVVAVEETARGWPLAGTMDLAEWSARRLGLPYVWGPAADHQFGTMLLSRVPVLDARVVPLPKGSGRMERSAIVAHVGPVAGRVVTVIAAHLQDGHTPSAKQTRVDELGVLLRAWDGAPDTVLAGDLNVDPGSRELAVILGAGFTTTQPTQACVLKTSNRNCVDWIFVTPQLTQSAVRAVHDDTFDHRPIVATVRPR